MLNVSSITKTSMRALYFVMGLSLALAYAVPQAGSFESRGNTSSAKWVSQAPVSSVSGGASTVNANAGDVLNFALTVQNTSSTDVFYSADALLDEPAPYVGAHELRVGATNDTVYSFFDYSYGTYVNNNRYATFETGDPVYRNQNLTFNWTMKLAAGLADGTYRYRVGVVQEYDAWLGDAPGPGAGGPNNNLGGRTGGTIFWDIVVGAGGTPTPSGALTIARSSQTPAATQIADNGNANFTRFTLTAAPGTTASISSIYVTRDGLSTDSEVENIKLLDANSVQIGNTAGGFNANHQAQVFFSPSLQVTGSQDFIIRAGIVDGSTANHTVRLGVASTTDIVSNASSVAGPPVYGNYMTIVDVTLGSLTLDEDGSMTDGTPDIGETDVVLNTFKLTAGSTEDIIIEQITVNKAGSADASDTTNIELWDVTHNVSLGTVANWSSSDKAVFPVSMTLAQGNVLRLRVQADIVDGSGLTVNADLVDGSDVLVFAKGALYGFYITPACVTTTNWTLDSGTGGTNNKGQGDKNQTINAGSLNISKAASTVPTGNIAQAADQVLGTWNFEARGEPIRISALSIDLSGTAADTADERLANFKSAKLYDENGSIVAGPVDGSADGGTALDRELDFTQTFVVPVGIHPYTLKVNIQTGAATDETVAASITAAGDVTAKTIRTNTSVSATGPASTLNTMTVKAGALVSTVLSTPVARTIVPGTPEFTWMTGKYDATTSGEDILITAQQFSLVTGTGADVDLLLDITIWADIDGNGTFETQLSSPETNSGNALAADIDDTITYDKHTLTVPKGTFVNIAYIASLSASAGTDAADAGDKFTISFDGDPSDVTASGKDTGTAITTAPTGTGPVITVTDTGALTTTLDSSTPLSSLIVGGSQGVHVSTFRFAADNVEDIRLDQIILNEATATELDVTTGVSIKANRDNTGALVTPYEIASGALTTSGDNTFTLNPNTSLRPVVPANNYILIYVYVNAATIDGTIVQNADAIEIDLLTNFTATGMGSGGEITATVGTLSGSAHQLYKSIPTVTLSPNSPSGNLILSTTTEIARFRITADAADDITFDNGAYSTLSVQITAYNTDFAHGSTSAVTLKNLSNGLTIASPAAADIGSTAAAKTTQVDFTFEDNGTFTVPAGDYRDVAVIADVTLFEDAGDSIVAWLSDDAATDFGWAINSATAQGTTAGTADISFRGDIYGHTLVKAG